MATTLSLGNDGADNTPKPPFPTAALAIAAVAVALLVGLFALLGHRSAAGPRGEQPLAAYAQNLPISGVTMSESESLSGGKDTYIDGTIGNTGVATVTAVTVQVLFRNDEKMAPQIETVPLTLVRTRQPYVDTEPVSAEPLAPGAQHDFRLIFESIGANWNQALPEIHVIAVQAR